METIDAVRCERVGGGLGAPDAIPVKDPGAAARDRPWHSVPLHPPAGEP